MTWIAAELKSLLAVVVASLDEAGTLLDANAGFMRVIEAEGRAPAGMRVAQHFIQPDFTVLVCAAADANGEIHRGLLTIGDHDGRTRTLNVCIWREADEIRLLGEYAIEELERVTDTFIELNHEYAHAQLELAQANLKVRQLNADLEQRVAERTQELQGALVRAEAANRAKSIFLANMSHELRTPMTGIMGMTDIALRRATDPKQIDQLNKSQGAARHLLAVINDILDISKIEADRLRLEDKPFSLRQAIDEAMAMQNSLAQLKGLTLSCEVSHAVPDLFLGDAFRLRQILINFVGNAIKFSERGQIIVRAAATEHDSDSVLLRIEVKDQGLGITPEVQARLFHAFTQADDSMTRKYGGTGLGLIISKRLALLMDGDVGVVSEMGCGSTFWATVRLRLALAEAHSDAGSQMEPARETLAKNFQGTRILLADDEPVTRTIMTFLLEDAGLCADVAVNGQDALEKVRDGDYVLILMDMQMPIMNGLEATRAIRLLPSMATIPILALTANAFDDDRERCLAAGMNDHIGKPVDADTLCATLLHWLQKTQNSTIT